MEEEEEAAVAEGYDVAISLWLVRIWVFFNRYEWACNLPSTGNAAFLNVRDIYGPAATPRWRQNAARASCANWTFEFLRCVACVLTVYYATLIVGDRVRWWRMLLQLLCMLKVASTVFQFCDFAIRYRVAMYLLHKWFREALRLERRVSRSYSLREIVEHTDFMQWHELVGAPRSAEKKKNLCSSSSLPAVDRRVLRFYLVAACVDRVHASHLF